MMKIASSSSRRGFLKTSAALVVSFTLSDAALALVKTAPPGVGPVGKSLDAKTLDAFIGVHPDGSVTVFTGKVDLGTGIMTALAQIVAEEMELPIERIEMVQGDTALTVDQGPTFGSLSVQVAGVTLRQAGATAREALKGLAAKQFNVRPDQVQLVNGTASVTGQSSRKLSYAALLHDQKLDIALNPKVEVKDAKTYKLVGQPVRRDDIPVKVTGEFMYMQDMKVPGMLHARVIRPQAIGAKLTAVDEHSVAGLPDVRIVRKGDFLAVVARKEWTAIKAARQLKATWSTWAGLPEQSNVYTALRQLKIAETQKMVHTGDFDKAMSSGAKTLNATYMWPAQTHGSIGPSCAIAEFKGDQLTLWSATQAPHLTRDQIATLVGLPKDKVRLIYVEGSGCYGRNGHEDATADAAIIAREIGKPVRVQWMRQDEHGWDPKGPPVVNALSGAIDANGKIVAWRNETWEPYRIKPTADVPLLAGELLRQSDIIDEPSNPGSVDKNTPPTYTVPNVQAIVNRTATTFFRPAWLRGPGRLQNTYANESFMDELAALSGIDPVTLRLNHIADARGIAVLKAATEKAGWQPRTAASGKARHAAGQGDLAQGRGVAYVRYDGDRAYVAAVADVEVNRKTGEVRVTHFTVAHDCGLIINTDGVRNQIEGMVVQTVSRTLYEEITFSQSAVTSVDWASYPILKFPDMPTVDVVLIDKPDQPALGAGEPTCAVVPSAIADAIYDAVGVRMREVPFKPERVLAALKA